MRSEIDCSSVIDERDYEEPRKCPGLSPAHTMVAVLVHGGERGACARARGAAHLEGIEPSNNSCGGSSLTSPVHRFSPSCGKRREREAWRSAAVFGPRPRDGHFMEREWLTVFQASPRRPNPGLDSQM